MEQRIIGQTTQLILSEAEPLREGYAAWNRCFSRIETPYLSLIRPGMTLTDEGIRRMEELQKKGGAGLLSCGYVMTEGGRPRYPSPEKNRRVMDPEDFLCRLFYLENDVGFLFHKLLRTEVIRRFRLRLSPKMGTAAERLFLVQYVKHIDSVCLLPERFGTWALDQAQSYDESTAGGLYRIRRSLLFHGDARWLCGEAAKYFEEEG